jgi:hypothetical protein
MQSEGWHFVEQSSFVVTGLLFWWPVVQPWPSVLRPDLSMILYLFFATLPCDLLSGFLCFAIAWFIRLLVLVKRVGLYRARRSAVCSRLDVDLRDGGVSGGRRGLSHAAALATEFP